MQGWGLRMVVVLPKFMIPGEEVVPMIIIGYHDLWQHHHHHHPLPVTRHARRSFQS